MIGWHNLIVSKAPHAGDYYQCFHCEKFYPRNQVCGDHFPHTKGSRPDLRYDVNNGVCSCAKCNVSNAPTRKKP